jgi:TonB family protein
MTRLSVRFSDKGQIEDVDVLKSSGHVELDDSVRNQLLSGKCTSITGTFNGKPQPSKTTVDYLWKLDEPSVESVQSNEILSVSSNRIATVDFAKNGCSPEYPRVSLRNNEQGMTTLAVKVNEAGVIEDVMITKTSGFRVLDNAVAEKLKLGTCLANPAMKDGKNVESTINVAYVWKLS